MTVDVDSTICEVHGYHKQGACYGYTRTLGYHPLLATRADTGEVLHARLRKGGANTARGIARFVDELVARLRRAGASGELTLRMDSGFWSAKLIRRLRRHRVRYSITVRQTKTVRAAMAAIPEQAWVDIAYQPGGVAQVAEVRFKGDRLIVRRVRNLGDQQQLFPTWRYHAFVTDRVGTASWLDADHRRHAVCELAIRDLKAGAGLAHLPSSQFNANAAWLLAATRQAGPLLPPASTSRHGNAHTITARDHTVTSGHRGIHNSPRETGSVDSGSMQQVPCQGCASAPNRAAFMVITAPGAAPYGLCGYRCSTMQVRVRVTPSKT
jgi:Transposase DDE domain group 1